MSYEFRKLIESFALDTLNVRLIFEIHDWSKKKV